MTLLDYAMCSFLLLVSGVALLRGLWPERLVALTMLLAFAVNLLPLARAVATGEPLAPLSAHASLAIDITMLGALVAVAVSSRPAWTLFPAAFQLLATLVSFVNLTNDRLSALAYVTSQNTLWWLTMAALAWGCIAPGRVAEPGRGSRARAGAPGL